MVCQVKVILVISLMGVTLADKVAPGLDRSIPDGVKSVSTNYEVIYGDKDMKIVNEIVQEIEKVNLHKEKDIFDAIEPMPREDVKCLMSADRYCSHNMRLIKDVLIQAVKEDCKKCSDEEKNKAGQIVATMLIHDPVAWKLFLTRTTLLFDTNKIKQIQEFDYKPIGQPEEIVNKRNRYILKGKNVKVRVRRYAAEIVPRLNL